MRTAVLIALIVPLTVIERHLDLNPDDLNAQLFKAGDLFGLGRREEAFEVADAVLAGGSGDTRVSYNSACFYSKVGEVDKALDALEMAVDSGYYATEWIRQDSDLDNIRDQPRFEELLQRMEVNRAAQASES